MWRWPWPGVGVGSFGAVGGSPPPPPPAPTPVTGANEARPVTPNLPPYQSRAQSLAALTTDVNRLAAQASLAATENPHWVMRHLRQIVPLSLTGLTTDTAVPMLLADSLLSHVTVRITAAVSGATSLDVGDATTAKRFVDAQTTLTAGTGVVGLNHWNLGLASQSADAAIRVTADTQPTAGALEITTWFWLFRVPGLPVQTITAPAPPSGTVANGGLRLFGGRWLG